MVTGNQKKYIAIINEKKIPVEVISSNEDLLKIKINNKEIELKVIDNNDNTYFVNIDGRVFRIDINVDKQSGSNLYDSYINGLKIPIKFMRESDLTTEDYIRTGSKERVKFITVSMPGKVVKILVKENEKITKSQQLCIIEAMKMENVVKAPADGIIKSVFIKEGQNIESQEKLFEIM